MLLANGKQYGLGNNKNKRQSGCINCALFIYEEGKGSKFLCKGIAKYCPAIPLAHKSSKNTYTCFLYEIK